MRPTPPILIFMMRCGSLGPRQARRQSGPNSVFPVGRLLVSQLINTAVVEKSLIVKVALQ